MSETKRDNNPSERRARVDRREVVAPGYTGPERRKHERRKFD